MPTFDTTVSPNETTTALPLSPNRPQVWVLWGAAVVAALVVVGGVQIGKNLLDRQDTYDELEQYIVKIYAFKAANYPDEINGIKRGEIVTLSGGDIGRYDSYVVNAMITRNLTADQCGEGVLERGGPELQHERKLAYVINGKHFDICIPR